MDASKTDENTDDFYLDFKTVDLLNDQIHNLKKVSQEIVIPKLHVACITNNRDEVKQLLLDPSTNQNEKVEGLTPLHIACILNNSRLVDILLGVGGYKKTQIDSVNTPTKNGATPLHLACLVGNEIIVESLLLSGADTTQIYKNNTPLELAKKKGFTRIVELINSPPLPISTPLPLQRSILLGGGNRKKSRNPNKHRRVLKSRRKPRKSKVKYLKV